MMMPLHLIQVRVQVSISRIITILFYIILYNWLVVTVVVVSSSSTGSVDGTTTRFYSKVITNKNKKRQQHYFFQKHIVAFTQYTPYSFSAIRTNSAAGSSRRFRCCGDTRTIIYHTGTRLSSDSDFVTSMDNEVLLPFRSMIDPSKYHRMDVPTRATAATHAVYGTLSGTGMIEQYQLFKNIQLSHASESESESKSKTESDNLASTNNEYTVAAYVKLGRSLDGHEGVVHGGILALLIDDVLGFGYEAIGVSMAFTANLNVNYLSPVMAESQFLVTATLTSQQGRKLFWKSQIVNEANEVSCEATSLYVIPRQTTVM